MSNNAQTIFDRCAVRLLRMYPFFGSLLLRLEVQQSTHLPTMATDGVTLWYNPHYVAQQREVIVCTDQAHEAGHNMFRDHLRRKQRDPGLWNVATDYRINYYLKDSGLELGHDYLYDERFHRWQWDAEQIYDFLEQNPDDRANQQAQEKGGCGCGGLHDHPSQGNTPTEGKQGESSPATITNVDFGESEVLMAIAQARAFAKGRGSMPGGLDEIVQEILDPKIRWEQELQRFMEYCSQDDFSWHVPDRRFLYLDMYLPGIESEGVDTFIVSVDVSGSTQKHVPKFLGHVSQIVKTLKFHTLHVIYCDAKVQHVDEYMRADLPIRPNRTYGGGGTDFRPVFNWVEEHGITPKGMVFLTDTDGPFPKNLPPYPVLWAVPGDRKAKVPFGEVVNVD